jgi:hypothetical protein
VTFGWALIDGRPRVFRSSVELGGSEGAVDLVSASSVSATAMPPIIRVPARLGLRSGGGALGDRGATGGGASPGASVATRGFAASFVSELRATSAGLGVVARGGADADGLIASATRASFASGMPASVCVRFCAANALAAAAAGALGGGGSANSGSGDGALSDGGAAGARGGEGFAAGAGLETGAGEGEIDGDFELAPGAFGLGMRRPPRGESPAP